MPRDVALRAITMEPARAFGLDGYGRLTVGQRANLVVWSGDPLSTYSICEQTWIDGRKYFDIEVDTQMVERDTQLRNALIQKALASHEKPDKGQKKKKKRHYQEHSCGVEVIQ